MRKLRAQQLIRERQSLVEREYKQWIDMWTSREKQEGGLSEDSKVNKDFERMMLVQRKHKLLRDSQNLENEEFMASAEGQHLLQQLEHEHQVFLEEFKVSAPQDSGSNEESEAVSEEDSDEESDDMLDMSRDVVEKLTHHIKGTTRAKMFADAMSAFASQLIYGNEDLVEECLATVNLMDPDWLGSYVQSLPDAVNAAGTQADPVDIEDSDDDSNDMPDGNQNDEIETLADDDGDMRAIQVAALEQGESSHNHPVEPEESSSASGMNSRDVGFTEV